MPRYLIQRTLGNITEDELDAAAEASSRVREEQFPDIEWEHSHVVRTGDGLTSYCIYAAPTAQRLREHAAASGLPADDVQEIHRDLQT
jgi:U3 small nucleolar ribonucleoprotein component